MLFSYFPLCFPFPVFFFHPLHGSWAEEVVNRWTSGHNWEKSHWHNTYMFHWCLDHLKKFWPCWLWWITSWTASKETEEAPKQSKCPSREAVFPQKSSPWWMCPDSCPDWESVMNLAAAWIPLYLYYCVSHFLHSFSFQFQSQFSLCKKFFLKKNG